MARWSTGKPQRNPRAAKHRRDLRTDRGSASARATPGPRPYLARPNDLKSFTMLTGGRGIHVVVPIAPRTVGPAVTPFSAPSPSGSSWRTRQPSSRR